MELYATFIFIIILCSNL